MKESNVRFSLLEQESYLHLKNELRESSRTESFCLNVFKSVINFINLHFKQNIMDLKITNFNSTQLAVRVNYIKWLVNNG